MTQPAYDLFDVMTDDGPLARPSHPDSSKSAAGRYLASGKIGPDRRSALRAVHAHPGSTAAELERAEGVHDGKIRKRLAWLADFAAVVRRGPKRVCSVTREPGIQTWWPVESVGAEWRAAVQEALEE